MHIGKWINGARLLALVSATLPLPARADFVKPALGQASGYVPPVALSIAFVVLCVMGMIVFIIKK